MATTWQPIETVPEDNRVVILIGRYHLQDDEVSIGAIEGGYNARVGVWYILNAHYRRKYKSEELTIDYMPTHWIDLPPLPPRVPRWSNRCKFYLQRERLEKEEGK